MRRRIAVIGIVIAALNVTPTVAASTTRPEPATDGRPPLQALTGDPAELDATFGTGGKVMTNIGGHRAMAVALQSDGKIVVAGEGMNDQGFGFGRYTATGSLDASFDGDGMANIDVGIFDTAVDVAIQSDGKIVAVGPNSPGGFCCEAAIVRLTSNGSPDSTFDSDGVVTTGLGAGLSSANAVAIQSDGKILVGGGGTVAGGGFTIGRFTTTGVLDSTFGTAGYATTAMGDGSAITDIAIQADGKIVAAGWASGDFGVVRYTSGGVLDTTFDGDGIVATDFGSTSDSASALALQGDGKIVVAGTGNDRFAVARYTTAGALDWTFDGDGKVTTAILGKNIEGAADVAIQSDGKIVAVGRAFDDFDSEYGIVRYDTDGWLDGRMITTFADPADDWADGVAIQGDGRIVVVGGLHSCSSACSWTMARYTSVTPIRALAAAPSSVDFGSVTVGAAPASASVSVTNTGSVSLSISLAEITGTATGVTITGDSCTGLSIAPKATCTVDLSYAPPSAATLGADLAISSDADVSPLAVPLQGTAVAPSSGVTWGSNNKAGPAYTWNGGGALARTVQSGTQRLHVAYATDRVGGAWAKDSGPYVGVYYVRSSTGSTWSSTPKRLNPSTQHAARLGLAAAGSRVYATWVSQTKWVNYSRTAPRVIYVRVNTNHGSSTAWKSAIRLTSTSRRVDYPTIAATGDDAYVAYTDATTGEIRVARSNDRGATWSKTVIGTTTISTSEGRSGLPSVAANGSTVVVAWVADSAGTVKARVSTNRGSTWSTAVTVGSQSVGYASASVLGSRIAIAWTTPDDVVVRQALSGTWGTAKLVESLTPDGASLPYAPQVVLNGTTRIAVAWSVSKDNSNADLRWAESADGGDVWFAPQTLASSTSSSARRVNDWASVVWPSAGTRYVVWNGWRVNSVNYRLYLRKGSGAPAGVTTAAPDWQPTSSTEQTVDVTDVESPGSGGIRSIRERHADPEGFN